MIKCDKGNVELRGNIVTLESELTCILKHMRKALTEAYKNEAAAYKMIDSCLSLSRMSDDDLDKEFQNAKKDLAEKLMNLINDF